jgi:exonuclease III
MGMRFVTWNVGGFCRSGSLKKTVKEFRRFRCDVVGVQDVRRDGDLTEPAQE